MKKVTQWEDTDIEKLIRAFDWERTHRFMLNNNWTWGVEQHVPSIQEMKDNARCLFQELFKYKDTHALCSGGFEVSMSDQGLGLQFIVEEAFLDVEGEVH